jgi:hypothetical protein
MSNTTNPMKQRYHRIDGWRGFPIPSRAIAGASDTGMWEDSPAPSNKVKAELDRFRKEALRANGIQSRVRTGGSSNVFMGKRWVIVSEQDFARAAQLTVDWLADHYDDTDYIHEADLNVLGYKAKDGGRKVA